MTDDASVDHDRLGVQDRRRVLENPDAPPEQAREEPVPRVAHEADVGASRQEQAHVHPSGHGAPEDVADPGPRREVSDGHPEPPPRRPGDRRERGRHLPGAAPRPRIEHQDPRGRSVAVARRRERRTGRRPPRPTRRGTRRPSRRPSAPRPARAYRGTPAPEEGGTSRTPPRCSCLPCTRRGGPPRESCGGPGRSGTSAGRRRGDRAAPRSRRPRGARQNSERVPMEPNASARTRTAAPRAAAAPSACSNRRPTASSFRM